MSLSKPKHIAPPVLGPSDLLGLTNQIILIEYPDTESYKILEGLIGDSQTLIINPSIVVEEIEVDKKNILFSQSDRISQACIIAKKLAENLDLIIMDRIDMMNVDYTKKAWAAQMKAYLSAFGNKKNLQGCNLILTSTRTEYLIREIADQFYNLK